MMPRNLHVHVYRDVMRRGSIAVFAGLYIQHQWHSMRLSADDPQPVPEHEPEDPLFWLDDGAAQSLLDQLWSMGLRPKQVMTADATNAVQAKHLEDMRTIVFAKLNIDPPGRSA